MSHTKTANDPSTGGAGKAGSTTNPCFEIGITMAGAVSAGAYTAGAVDFLIEALDAWYAAKEDDEDAPQHDISLNVLTGASAGSIVAAIMAVCLNYRFPHCRAETIKLDDEQLTGNPLMTLGSSRLTCSNCSPATI
jgi:predicted acylesterase/phospholipase RssA